MLDPWLTRVGMRRVGTIAAAASISIKRNKLGGAAAGSVCRHRRADQRPARSVRRNGPVLSATTPEPRGASLAMGPVRLKMR